MVNRVNSGSGSGFQFAGAGPDSDSKKAESVQLYNLRYFFAVRNLILDTYCSWQEARAFVGRRAYLSKILLQVNGLSCANERRCNIIKIFQDRSATALQRMGSAALFRVL